MTSEDGGPASVCWRWHRPQVFSRYSRRHCREHPVAGPVLVTTLRETLPLTQMVRLR
jgi:hypothetical protein